MKRTNAALKVKRPAEAEAPAIDFDELPTYVGYQVRRTQAKIFGEFEATLTGLDFTPGSFGVLTLVRANPGITQVALAAAFRIIHPQRHNPRTEDWTDIQQVFDLLL